MRKGFFLVGLLTALTARPVQAQENCATRTVTAYAQSEFSGTTASGRPTAGNVGVIVAEGGTVNHLWAFGTSIWIDGIGSRVVADRGGGLVAGHVDILMQTRNEALAWGRQQRQVCVGE